MPENQTEMDAPYAHIAASYDRMVELVIAERGESPRHRMGDFLETVWSNSACPVHEVLEICCGTGLMLADLARREYAISGLDQSPAMLEHARQRLGPQVPLIRAELPDIPVRGRFDAVISAATGLNYLTAETLADTFASVRQVLRPGGGFVFDLLSRLNLERSFDDSQPGVRAAELDGVSYIWTFEAPASRSYFDLTHVQFLRTAGAAGEFYTRSQELHRMYPQSREEVRNLASRAGFAGAMVYDNYTDLPAGPETLYETWVLTTPGGNPHTSDKTGSRNGQRI